MEEEEAVQQPPSRAPHIKKRALKNKALAVSFNEKDLKDFVTGFHKRKKKRRKEAQKQQEEVLRRKRIEERKKRKLEREVVLYGGAAPPSDESEEDEGNDEESNAISSVDGTMEYDNGDIKVTVTTSEICQEDENVERGRKQTAVLNTTAIEKNRNLAVSKNKPFKKVLKHRSRSKTQNKRDGKKGKKRSRKP